jgi:hypothetical protein
MLSDLPSDSFDTESAAARRLACQLEMQRTEVFALADEIGFAPSELVELLALTAEQRIEFLRLARNAQPNLGASPTFPSSESANSERRKQKIAEYAANAVERTFEKRERSVRVTVWSVWEDTESYLRDLYLNEEDKMVCQICGMAMPFRRRDGKWYFEQILCIGQGVVTREVFPNHLALCPICAAKFKHIINTPPKELRQRLIDAAEVAVSESEPITVDISLGDAVYQLKFVRDHILDLLVVLTSDAAILETPETVAS